MLRSSLLALLLATPALHAESLTQADKEALMEKLDALSDTAKEKAMSRMGTAISDFRAGMASDEAAVNLYMECVEKVQFKDQKRSAQDFREWKRRESERLDQEGLKRCLRHQLRWLMLTMEAAEKPDEVSGLAPRASEALDSIFSNPDQFEGNVEALRQPVTESMFARAYGLGNLKAEKWPLSPLDLPQVFDQIMLPPLRGKGSYDGMREQWQRRIRYEGIVRQSFTGRREKGKKEESSPEYDKWISEGQPDMVWQMELDLYKAGDQKKAAERMLEHLETNVTHPKARDWGMQFRTLIEPGKSTTETAKGQ
jgi:hypothetical protein